MTLRIETAIAVSGIVVLALLSGCSKQEAPASGSAESPASATAQKEAPKREEVDQYASAPEAFSRMKCASVDKAAGPDVFGVQMGMSFDNALMAIRCQTKDRGHFEYMTDTLQAGTEGIVDRQGLRVRVGRRLPACEDEFLKGSNYNKWDIQCMRGQYSYRDITETIDVVSPGLPQAQTTVGIWRVQKFPAGEGPTVQAAVDAIKAKYGPATKEEGFGGAVRLFWLKNPDGTPMDPARSGRCQNGVYTDVAHSAFEGECGHSIRVEVDPVDANKLLVESISVAMIDPQRALQVSDQLTAYVKAEKAKGAQKEAERAKSMDDVKL